MEKKNNTSKKVRPIPKGFGTVTPYLLSSDAASLIKFMKSAFGGELTYIMKMGGKVMHATVKIGNSTVITSDTPEPFQPMPCQLFMYVEDVDAVYKKALKAGATSTREPLDEFYGDRSAAIKDNWGNSWWIATHIEDVSEEELKKRAKEFGKSQEQSGKASA